MILVPLIVNAIVICILSADLVAAAVGMASADQLLVVSALSGLLTILSFKLSKEALSLKDDNPDSLCPLDEQVADEV